MLLTGGLLGLLYVIFAVVLFNILSVGLVPMLLIALAVGLVISGPRRELRNPWLWAGVAIAAVLFFIVRKLR